MGIKAYTYLHILILLPYYLTIEDVILTFKNNIFLGLSGKRTFSS